MENLFLFEDLPFHARLRVGRIVNELFVTPNQEIMKQGELGDTLYVVVQGQVSVQIDSREVAVLSEGEHFGELALIDRDPRSATVVAKGFGHLLSIERDTLREYCLMEPALGNLVLWKLIATLGRRLRHTNAQLTAASAGNG
jgi:CRP-like cAMP-binding protein